MQLNGKLVYFLFIILFLNGCYSLRRKFIRKKKYHESPTVYVNFKQYPEPSAKKVYKSSYLFVVGWTDELINQLEGSTNHKRVRKAIGEIILDLKQINNILNKQGKKKLAPIYKGMIELKASISPNLTAMDKNIIVRRLEGLKLKFYNNFRYSIASQWIKPD